MSMKMCDTCLRRFNNALVDYDLRKQYLKGDEKSYCHTKHALSAFRLMSILNDLLSLLREIASLVGLSWYLLELLSC